MKWDTALACGMTLVGKIPEENLVMATWTTRMIPIIGPDVVLRILPKQRRVV